MALEIINKSEVIFKSSQEVFIVIGTETFHLHHQEEAQDQGHLDIQEYGDGGLGHKDQEDHQEVQEVVGGVEVWTLTFPYPAPPTLTAPLNWPAPSLPWMTSLASVMTPGAGGRSGTVDLGPSAELSTIILSVSM